MTTAYLASPIDLHGDPTLIEDLRRDWVQTLYEMGFSAVFNPASAWGINPAADPDPGLQQMNLAALDAATALVAILPTGVPTLGVPLEIHQATSRGKPTLVVGPTQASWTLAWFARGGTLFFEDDLEGFAHAVAERVPATREEREWDERTQQWLERKKAGDKR